MSKSGTQTTQETKLRMRFLQSQMQLVRLLEQNSAEVEDEIRRELEANPALEALPAEDAPAPQQNLTDDGTPFTETSEDIQRADYLPDDIPSYRLSVRNREADWRAPEINPSASEESLYDFLLRQLGERTLAPAVELAAEYIIGSLDPDGYLRRPLSNIADDMAFSEGLDDGQDVMEEAYAVVRQLEPRGVGARDLRDALLLQLENMAPGEARNDATAILRDHYEAFSKLHSHRLVSALHIPASRVESAMRLIQSLNPKPGSSLGGAFTDAPQLVPDFTVSNEDGLLSVTVNNRAPRLVVSSSFERAVREMEKNARARNMRREGKYTLDRYNAARGFIELLRQRDVVLHSVIAAIMEMQRDYFLTDDVDALRPMTIHDIARRTGYDPSMVSRATKGKYIGTRAGIFPVRFFFAGELGEEGKEFTNLQVQNVMRALIDAEDKKHPLSDDKLQKLLAAKGYDISRRTVAKYRDRLEIPVARLRKQI